MTNKANGFLPTDYTPTSTSEFTKLVEGDNKVRILAQPLIGRLWWMSPEGVLREKGNVQKGDKPMRVSYKDELPENIIEVQTKEFWMMKVWDYRMGKVAILEITQQTIIKNVHEYIMDAEWGDPRFYDINFKKQGSGKDTKYFVMPSPQKELPEDIKTASEESNINLEQFLTKNKREEDPFEGMEDVQTAEEIKKEIEAD
jgi:hypothetical protein